MKHLKVLEDNSLVDSFEEKSTLGGPPRRSYVANRRISLRIDVGPNTFNTEIYDYREIEHIVVDKSDDTVDVDKDMTKLEDEFEQIQNIEDPSVKLTKFSKTIQNVNEKLEELKFKRSKLLSLREAVIEESNKIIIDLCQEYNERKILYYLLANSDRDISRISEIMEMREKVIKEIFKNLIDHRIFMDLNVDEDIF